MPAQLSEKWLPIPGYEAFYEVSTSGRVYSLARAGTGGGVVYPWASQDGRLQVKLSKYSHTQVRLVGVLVLLAHGKNPRPSRFARPYYRNGDVTDNSLSNLSWAQWPDGRATGMPPVKRGEAVHTAKLTAEIVADCRRRARRGVPQKELCAEYGVGSAAMSQAIHGITWKSVTSSRPLPRGLDGRTVYGWTDEARAQRRANAATTNRLRYGPAA